MRGAFVFSSEARVIKKLNPRKYSALAVLCLTAFSGPANAQTTTATEDETPATTAIPTVPLPDPNGYDFYLRAGAALKKDNPGPPSAAAKDAATDLALQRAYAANNAETLRLLREGFRYPARRAASRTQGDISKDFPSYSQFREISRLLVQESRVRLADGDQNGAADSLLDAIRLGTDVVRGGPFMAMLVGVAIESVGRADLWSLANRLDAPNARRIARRLEEIEAARVPLAVVVEEEKWLGLSLLRETMSTPDWKAMRAGKLPDQPPKDVDAEEAKALALFKNTSDAQIQANYIGYMDAVIANTRKPYNPVPNVPPAPADPMSAVYAGEIIAGLAARLNHEQSVAANCLLLVTLALRAYRMETGALPATLDVLAPQYLTKLPVDPFSPSAAAPRYRAAQDDYVLYSVGPDGLDNDGQAIPTKRRIDPQSKGDIVVGANT
jgi:hypothetical protein